MWKVEVVSHESIKPSSPTPPHHSTHRLSWLDRMNPPDPFTFIFFYPDVAEPVDKTLPILKKSLSRTLALFYPLAGRLNPNDVSIVDCNDQGVDLFEARAASDAPLSQLLDRCAVRDQLIPLQPPSPAGSSPPPPLLSIQITTFVACGSVAIAASFSHALVDAHSAAEFIAAWSNLASTSRDGHTSCGDDSQVAARPVFDAASRFGPPSADCSDMQDSARRRLRATSGKEVAKRFVFEEPAIDALRKSPTDHPAAAPPPTRVVALAALLWRCCVRVRANSVDGCTRFAAVALIPVNMRGKAPALLPDHLFGNLCDTVAVAAPSETIGDRANVGQAKLSSEEKLRSGIRRTDGEWVRRLQGEEKLSALLKSFREVEGEAANYGGGDSGGGGALICSFTSWSRFPLYEADFGWGKPSLVAPGTTVQIGNGVVVMGRGAARGMEAWVKLEEEDMLEFERDKELMSYASPLFSASA